MIKRSFILGSHFYVDQTIKTREKKTAKDKSQDTKNPHDGVYLWCGLSQTHHGLSLWGRSHRTYLQVVRFQLCDGGEEGRSCQRRSREMCGGSVHLFVAPKVQGHLFTDGGRPGAPLMLNSYEIRPKRFKNKTNFYTVDF